MLLNGQTRVSTILVFKNKKIGSPARIPAKRQGQRLEMAFELLISVPGLHKAREKKSDSQHALKIEFGFNGMKIKV